MHVRDMFLLTKKSLPWFYNYTQNLILNCKCHKHTSCMYSILNEKLERPLEHCCSMHIYVKYLVKRIFSVGNFKLFV